MAMLTTLLPCLPPLLRLSILLLLLLLLLLCVNRNIWPTVAHP